MYHLKYREVMSDEDVWIFSAATLNQLKEYAKKDSRKHSRCPENYTHEVIAKGTLFTPEEAKQISDSNAEHILQEILATARISGIV